MITTYRSKIGVGLFLFVHVILLGVLLIPVFTSESHDWVGSFIILLTVAFVNYTLFTIRYDVSRETLRIKCGFLYDEVLQIQAIKKIEKSRSILSSPAASLDRLEISYNKWDTVLISPKDKEAFVAQLKQLNPEIVVKM